MNPVSTSYPQVSAEYVPYRDSFFGFSLSDLPSRVWMLLVSVVFAVVFAVVFGLVVSLIPPKPTVSPPSDSSLADINVGEGQQAGVQAQAVAVAEPLPEVIAPEIIEPTPPRPAPEPPPAPQPSQTPATVPPPQPTRAELNRRAGERMVININNIEYAFRWCPAGSFMMGSPLGEAGRFGDEQQHEVTLSRGFWLLETEVTQAMWESVMGSNPSGFKGAKLPVESVSWDDCQEFITNLNEVIKRERIMSGGRKPPGESRVQTGGLAPAALEGYKFSLPTEAQWEYACRADTTTAYHFGDTLTQQQANFGGNVGRTRDVGSYPANAWGLCDMHGNVREWCADWFGNYPTGALTNPTGTTWGANRVIRGGC